MDADLYPKPGGPSGDDWITLKEEAGWYAAAGRRAEASRHSLTDHETPAPDAPAWMRSSLPEMVARGLMEDDERRRDAALDKLRRAVRAWQRGGIDEL